MCNKSNIYFFIIIVRICVILRGHDAGVSCVGKCWRGGGGGMIITWQCYWQCVCCLTTHHSQAISQVCAQLAAPLHHTTESRWQIQNILTMFSLIEVSTALSVLYIFLMVSKYISASQSSENIKYLSLYEGKAPFKINWFCTQLRKLYEFINWQLTSLDTFACSMHKYKMLNIMSNIEFVSNTELLLWTT